jgi:L,D-transpeptidase YcbB
VKQPFKRALCGALMLALVPTVTSAATTVRSHPNIAVGMAIPSNLDAPHASLISLYDRFVLIDAESAKLFMIEGGAVHDSMRVIVGKPTAATPTVTSSVHYATLNPYWHVPTDLARTIIAPRVLAEGKSYLRERGYEVVSSFSADAHVLDPDSVDWSAVRAGREKVFVRQRPGPANSMGQIKFRLITGDGIYLHDTPNRELFARSQRNLSNGCVRLEDAPRLARWLLGHDPDLKSAAPEQHVPLPGAVPIIITHLDPLAQVQLAAVR